MGVGKRREERQQQIMARLKRDKVLPKSLTKMAAEMGYHRGRAAMQPSRHAPGPKPGEKHFVRWLKAALSSILGLPVDASRQMNRATRAALKAFQRKEGLTAHGFADERTLQVLELRTGLHAPRNVGHEGIPVLLLVPLKKPWQPKKKGKGDGEDDPSKGASETTEDPRIEEAEKVAKVAALEAKVKLAQTAVNTAAKDLVKALDFDSPQKTADASRIKNKCVVLVGTLHGMSRADAKTAITAAGGHWRDTITCKTELIVLGLSEPSALEKADETAEQKQIDTITGNELLEEFRLAGVSDVKAPAKPAKKKREDGEVQGVTRGGKTRRTSLPAA